MKRRSFLGGIAAMSAALTGCTYAYGGGDERETVSIPSPHRQQAGYMFDRFADSSFIIGQSGMGWHRNQDGDMEFAVASRLSRVSQEGETVWRFKHDESTEAIAIGHSAYLLQDEQIVASPPIDSSPETQWSVEWTMTRPASVDHIAAVEDTVALVDGRTVSGYRESSNIWETTIDDPVQFIDGKHGGFAIRTADTLHWVDVEGEHIWERAVRSRSHEVTTHEEGVLLLDADAATVVDPSNGETIESYPISTGATLVRSHSSAIPVAHTGHIELLSRDITVPLDTDPEDLLVFKDDHVYLLRETDVVAADADGIRWRRPLDDRIQDVPLAGWVDGDRIGCLYAGGDIVFLQRIDKRRPLVW